MRAKNVSVSLREADFRKRAFLLSFCRSDGDLRQSIAAVGVVNKPLVWRDKSGERYTIVSGFRRLGVAKALGMQRIECREIVAPTREKDLFLLALFENLGERVFNPVEIGMALARLGAFFCAGEIVRTFLPLFHLEPALEQYEKYRSLIRLEPAIRRAVASQRLSVATARQMVKIQRSERTALFGLFQELQLGVNLQKEFLAMLFDISRRDETAIGAILRSPNCLEILRDDHLSLPQKTERLRRAIHRMRYPRLSAKEDEFRRFIARCKLPPHISIQHPPFFEGDTFTLTARFRSANEFHSVARVIQELSQKGFPATLFE